LIEILKFFSVPPFSSPRLRSDTRSQSAELFAGKIKINQSPDVNRKVKK